MPCATIHMLTSGRVLREWTRRPARSPVPVQREDVQRAFLLGAMGPDMGFVPGVDRFVSELAHYVSTGDLARRLLAEAGTARQRAFAWGWATHHVTDVEVHPLVGRACGEHLHGDRSLRLNSSADVTTHVAMEVGLDLVFLLDDPEIPRPPGEPLSGPSGLGFVCRALQDTYGIPWSPEELRRSHRTAVRRTARWPDLLRLLGRGGGFGPDGEDPGIGGRVAGGILALARGFVSAGTAAAGCLAPLRPPRWVVRRIRSFADAFPERFRQRVEGGLAGLGNRNLETGLDEDADVEHPDSERTLRRLKKLRTRRPGLTGSSAARRG